MFTKLKQVFSKELLVDTIKLVHLSEALELRGVTSSNRTYSYKIRGFFVLAEEFTTIYTSVTMPLGREACKHIVGANNLPGCWLCSNGGTIERFHKAILQKPDGDYCIIADYAIVVIKVKQVKDNNRRSIFVHQFPNTIPHQRAVVAELRFDRVALLDLDFNVSEVVETTTLFNPGY